MKFYPQHDVMDCGPACMAMVSDYHGKQYEIQLFRDASFINREGISLSGITQSAEKIGFSTLSIMISTEKLIEMACRKNPEIPLPCILHWNQNHFVVLYEIKKVLFSKKYLFKIADPGHGFITLSKENLEKSWLTVDNQGVVLLLEPTEKFYELNPEKNEHFSLTYLFKYLPVYKKQLGFIFLSLLLGSLLNLVLPFLTQNLIDKGIRLKNLDYIFYILFAQLGVFFGTITIGIFRNWVTLHVGTKLNIEIVSDFLKKLLKLPISFFDSKMNGDIQQRIQDNERIENFITSESILTFFSIITFLVFFCVLWYYNYSILLVYLTLTVLAILWSVFWLKKRKIVDYYKFQQQSQNQNSIWELINGVTEMKLNQFEDFKRKEWEEIQLKIFKINLRILKIDQFQLSGFEFLNQLKNILVTFLASSLVVKGKMTLGELLSVSFIIGQMNSPINQLITFFRSFQDAKLSLERLNEVQKLPDEEDAINKNIDLHSEEGIRFEKLSFQYEGPKSPFVLNKIDLTIPKGKITAIVGASGSGKTTLMKLLLKFYKPTQGSIYYNSNNINELSAKSLRRNCGVVMQDGYIFSDTIERNIATGDEIINKEKLATAVKIANLDVFINSLPLGYNTKIGNIGNGISGGQKQRILIARAVYKNPDYIFFDEATSALDAENEKIIHDNLQEFFRGKTVVIIAHRLSTVKKADQIIVLKNGEIVETGNHQELVYNKAGYYNLVKNQLELGN